MPYESLLLEAEQQGILIYEKPMPYRTKGLYADNVVWINQGIKTTAGKLCVAAEEIGHHYTTFGDILDQSNLISRKQEKKARTWAHKKLIPLSKIVQAHNEGIHNRFEMAEFLNVTEEFLEEALNRYREIYGTHTRFKNFTIIFDPLSVIN